VPHDVMVALLAGALLGRPGGDEGREACVECDIGNGWFVAQECGARAQVRVEGREPLGGFGGVFAGRGNVRGCDEPLLDLGFFGRCVLGRGQYSPRCDCARSEIRNRTVPVRWEKPR